MSGFGSWASLLKKSLCASEQDRPDAACKRASWHKELAAFAPEKLVFLDESGVQSNLTRLRGRSVLGERLPAKVPHGHWQTTTIISAVKLSGPCAPAIFNTGADTEVFDAYVEEVLLPALRPGDVLVMDNLAVHKVQGILERIDAAGIRVLFLPPYSPDYNPIEKMWSKVKALVRAAEARAFETIVEAVGKALCKVSREDCHGFFKSCGYAT
jgi:transposase